MRRTKDLQKRFFADSEIFEENREPIFSTYFLKFFQALSFWENPDLWKTAIPYILSISKCNSLNLFFSNHPKTIRKRRKSRLKMEKSVYMLFLQACNYLIKMDVNLMLENIFRVNHEFSHLVVNDYEELTRNIENIHFMENLNKIIQKTLKTKNEKIIFVMKHTLKYMHNCQKDPMLKVILLNKEINKKLFPTIIKRFLIEDSLNKKRRIILWRSVSKTETLSKHLKYLITLKVILSFRVDFLLLAW